MLKSAVGTQLLYCLKVTQTDADTGTSKSTIVFPKMEYDFTFYDGTYAKLYYITALVEDVYEDQIKIKYLNNNVTGNSSKDSVAAMQGMPNCSCVLNPPDLSKYEGPTTFFVPIMNILNIGYRWSSNNSNIQDTSEVRVMLLGISATAVKAIIIRMAFFEDSLDEAVKLVELKAGNIYDLTYEAKDGAVYESRVKVMEIEECPDKPTKPGRGFVREIVGCGNAIYTNNTPEKDEFMKAPPAPKIRVIVDTSEAFTGRYEAIMLDAIRDVTLVFDASKEDDGVNNPPADDDFCSHCPHVTANCNRHSCGHYLPPHRPPMGPGCTPPSTFIYSYKENGCKAVINGDKVQIMAHGNTTNICLEDLVKYYLAIE